jgi:hypothetical protein
MDPGRPDRLLTGRAEAFLRAALGRPFAFPETDMQNELKTGETVALVAVELRGHVCALADEYAGFLRARPAPAPAPADAQPGETRPVDPKAFQARHVAGRAAVAHMALLLKLAREIDGDPELSEESGAELQEEARLNLERPA